MEVLTWCDAVQAGCRCANTCTLCWTCVQIHNYTVNVGVCANTLQYSTGSVDANTFWYNVGVGATTLPCSTGGANTACHVRTPVSKPLITGHRCSKCSCHHLKIMTATMIIMEMVTMIIMKTWSSWPNKRKLSDIVLEVLIRKAWPTRGPDWLWEGSRPYLGIERSSARVSNASQGPRRDGERYRVIQSDPCFHGAVVDDHGANKKLFQATTIQMRLYKPVKAAGHALTCICNDYTHNAMQVQCNDYTQCNDCRIITPPGIASQGSELGNTLVFRNASVTLH